MKTSTSRRKEKSAIKKREFDKDVSKRPIMQNQPDVIEHQD